MRLMERTLTVVVCYFTIASLVSAQESGGMMVICPLTVHGRSHFEQLLHSPTQFYEHNQGRWVYVPSNALSLRENELPIPTECQPPAGYLCYGCRDVVFTYYECFHLRQPERRDDCGDNWCIVVELNLKTCFTGRDAGLVKCLVERVEDRAEYERRCGVRASPGRRHTVKFYGSHSNSWCRTREGDAHHEQVRVWWKCPDCSRVDRLRLWCLADERSESKCRQGRLVPSEILGQENPIEDRFGFICTNEDCSHCTRTEDGSQVEPDGTSEVPKTKS